MQANFPSLCWCSSFRPRSSKRRRCSILSSDVEAADFSVNKISKPSSKRKPIYGTTFLVVTYWIARLDNGIVPKHFTVPRDFSGLTP